MKKLIYFIYLFVRVCIRLTNFTMSKSEKKRVSFSADKKKKTTKPKEDKIDKSKSHRNWIVVVWDMTWKPDTNLFKYICWQKEEAPTTGKHHFQCYIQMAGKLGKKGILKLIGAKPDPNNDKCKEGAWVRGQGECAMHPELCTNLKARDYARKLESRIDGPWEAGLFAAGQGHNPKLVDVLSKTPLEVATHHGEIYVRHHRGLLARQQILVPRRKWKTEVFILYGERGTGKSGILHEYIPEEDLFVKSPGDLKWFDSYVGQEAALIDDFQYDPSYRDILLQLTDRYPMMVQTKGGMVSWCPKRLYITTNFNPQDWMFPALERRLTEIWTYTFDENDQCPKCSVNIWRNEIVPIMPKLTFYRNGIEVISPFEKVPEVAGVISGTSDTSVNKFPSSPSIPIPATSYDSTESEYNVCEKQTNWSTLDEDFRLSSSLSDDW